MATHAISKYSASFSNPMPLVAQGFGGGERRAGTGERIEHRSFTERQGGAHDLTQESLWA